MLQDLHSHTYYSYCGKDSPEAVIENAISCGLELVGISDHYYGIVMNKPGFVYESKEEMAHMHNNALKRYYDHIKSLAYKYRDKIEVWCGVEITALDWGYTLLADGVDVSYFDYCLIENFQMEESTIDDVLEFSKKCGCKRCGFAHMDLPLYLNAKKFSTNEFFAQMAKENVFWEINVNYDSIHGYKEHKYAKDFFENADLIQKVKESGIKLSVGFDGHRLEDYAPERVISACRRLCDLGVPLIK